MTTGPAPICAYCRHYTRAAAVFSCAAFPRGIPDGIIGNEQDHRQPVEGDHGIQFEQDPKMPALDEEFYEEVFR
jgi:hypothetical protein